jgi:hypothetical protein
MTISDELERMWKEMIITTFWVQNILGTKYFVLGDRGKAVRAIGTPASYSGVHGSNLDLNIYHPD